MTKWLQFLKLFSEKNQHLTHTEVLQKAKKSFMKLTNYYEQYGGGNCSLCGSPGTTKSTCPLNPDAKNPNPDKHPNASEAAPAPLVRASSVKAPNVPSLVRANSVKPLAAKKGKTAPVDDDRGCVEQFDKKYTERPSPPFPANQCCGKKMAGKEGRMYESRADKNGTCKWYILK